MVPIPACIVTNVDIPFPEKYRSHYDNVRERFKLNLDAKLAAAQDAWDKKSNEEKSKTKRPVEVSDMFLKSLSRQLLVAASVPWTLEY